MPLPEPVKITLHVTTGAPRNRIEGWAEGLLKVKVAAAPLKGKANKELLDFLSDRLGLKKSQVAMVQGETSRYKIVAISGLGREETLKRLVPDG
jgi:uncharacterized protein (TIGR00251 family)